VALRLQRVPQHRAERVFVFDEENGEGTQERFVISDS